jgi:hypothetical protein
MKNTGKLGLHLRERVSCALFLAAFFLAVGALDKVRGDNVLVADGPSQNLTSADKIYSTSTAQPAMLAIRGGTIASFNDLVTILSPRGLTGLQAQGIGSQITAQNLTIAGLGLGQTGMSGARGVDGGSVTLRGGKIEIAGDSSFGVFAGNGTVSAKGTLGITMTGVDSHGVEAQRSGSVLLGPGATIVTEGRGGIGIFARTGGTVAANGVVITTSGILSSSGFNADGQRH